MGKNENDIKLFKNYYHCVFFVPGKKRESQFEDDFVRNFLDAVIPKIVFDQAVSKFLEFLSFVRNWGSVKVALRNVSKIALFELEFQAI